ncbi:MAG: vWA domain-containing protein [Bacteroidota bacterium]|mgnify:CR=1 FL=1
MPGVDLSLSYHVAFAVLGLAAAFGISFLSYRHPVPPQPRRWKIVFIVLRTVALWALLFLVGQPVLSLVNRSTLAPVVEVLVDNSQSLTLTDGLGDRRKLLREALASPELSALASDAEVRWSLFDHSRRPVERWSVDSLVQNGDRTDIAGAFHDLRIRSGERKPAAVVLLTDGNATTPVSPVYEAQALGVPVIAVGVGDTSDPRDLRVNDVVSNATAYAGTRVPVNVVLHSSGAGGEQVDVVLDHRGRTMDRTTVTLDQGARDRRVTLFFTPDSAGLHRSTVTLSRLRGEITYRNNSASFLTRVLSDKIRILIVSAAPNQDAAFLRRSLSSDSNLTVTMRTGTPRGSFLEGLLTPEVVRQTDALILVGVPDAGTPDEALQLLLRHEFARLPVWYLPQRTTDFSRLQSLSSLLPVRVEQVVPTELSVFFSVPESRRLHPIVRVSNNGSDPWSSLPPVFRSQGTFRPRPDAEVLATVRLGATVLSEPFLVVRSAEGRRTAFLTGYGFWRWKLLAPATGAGTDVYDTFVSNVVRWLTAVEDERRIRVRPDRDAFSSLEAPAFTAQAYDESLQPVIDADIEVTARSGGNSTTVLLSPLGNGQYAGTFPLLPPGDYTYSATVRTGTSVLGEDRGTFSVGGLNVEFVETRMDRVSLEGLASRTGGAYFGAGDMNGLADRIRMLPGFQDTEQVRRSDLELWSSPWILGTLVLLFSLEWFLRKRAGML